MRCGLANSIANKVGFWEVPNVFHCAYNILDAISKVNVLISTHHHHSFPAHKLHQYDRMMDWVAIMPHTAIYLRLSPFASPLNPPMEICPYMNWSCDIACGHVTIFTCTPNGSNPLLVSETITIPNFFVICLLTHLVISFFHALIFITLQFYHDLWLTCDV